MGFRSPVLLTLLVALPGLSQTVPSAGMQQLASFPGTGWGAYIIVTGDFNGDGKLDLATPNYNTNTVTVVLGNGDGTFTPAPGSPFTVGETPDWLAVADFNGDGFADLAVSSAHGTVSILLGSASGAMTAGPGSPMSAGSEPFSVVAGDFNSDGHMDLILSNASSTLTLFLGQGDGGFNPPTYISTPLSCGCALAAGRFTPNGPLDVVEVSQSDNGLVLLKGDGSGNFQVGKLIATGLGPHIIAIGDINRDGLEDLVAYRRYRLVLSSSETGYVSGEQL